MKFSCDNCSAQYLIADEKLGRRGVKVRCKKCAYVIIVRPPGFDPSSVSKATKPAPEVSDPAQAAAKRSTQDLVPPRPEAEVGRPSPGLVPAPDTDARGATDPAGATGATRAAEGLDDARPAAPGPAAGLQLGVRWDEQVPPASPGAHEEAGDHEVADPPLRDSDIPSIGRPEQGDDFGRGDTTRIDTPSDGSTGAFGTSQGGRVFGVHDETRVSRVPSLGPPEAFSAPATAPVLADTRETPDGSGPVAPQPPMSGEDIPMKPPMSGEDIPITPPMSGEDIPITPPMSGENIPITPPMSGEDIPIDDLDEPVAPGVNSADVNGAFARFERDELTDMRSSLEGEIDKLGAEVEGVGDGPGAEPEPGRRLDLSALRALADEADDSAPAAGESDPSHGESDPSAAESDPSVAAEIGNAFEVMFGADPGDAGDAGDTSDASGEPGRSPAPAETAAEEARDDDGQTIANGIAESESPAAAFEWYVAIDDEQVGPIAFAELRTKWQTGAVGPTSLAWRHGMNDWTAIRLIEELAELHSPSRADRPDIHDEPMSPAAAAPIWPTVPEPEPEAFGGRAYGDPRPARAPAHAAGPTAESPGSSAAASGAAPASSGLGADTSGASEDDAGWRPSAASALASLAAEELASPHPPVTTRPATDVKAGPALPATTDALERLLEGDLDPRATAFGAAEKSESRVRPLPRQADAVSSVPLRDPIEVPRRSGQLGLVAAIVGGFILLGLIVVGGVYLLVKPTFTGWGPSAGSPPGGAPPPEVANVKPAMKGIGPSGSAVPADSSPDAGQASTEPSSAKPTPPEATHEAPGAPDKPVSKSEVKPAPESAEPKPASRRRRARRRRSPAKATPAPPPPPPPPSRAARTMVRPPPTELSDDSLINPGGARRSSPAPTQSIPKTLDETDILGVLRKNRAAVRDCLDKHKRSGSGVDGTMTVYMVVRKNGRPTRISVSPQFRDTVAGSCIVDTVKTWRFPRFSGDNLPVDFPVKVRGG